MRFKEKSIQIELRDPTSKGKIFSFETNKLYNSPQEELQDIRKIKIKKITNRKDHQ
jgi:hypothetical protein